MSETIKDLLKLWRLPSRERFIFTPVICLRQARFHGINH
jgi:hypothetical protein